MRSYVQHTPRILASALIAVVFPLLLFGFSGATFIVYNAWVTMHKAALRSLRECAQFFLVLLAYRLAVRFAHLIGLGDNELYVVAVLFLVNNPLLRTVRHNQVNCPPSISSHSVTTAWLVCCCSSVWLTGQFSPHLAEGVGYRVGGLRHEAGGRSIEREVIH
jgi:hypothetical protein